MGKEYIFISDFTRGDNNGKGVVESFAECLDTIAGDRKLDNKITPIYIARGEYGSFSLEPLFFCYCNEVPLIFSTAFRLAGEDESSIHEDEFGETFIYEMFDYNNDNIYNLGYMDEMSQIDMYLAQAESGNVRVDNTIDKSMFMSLLSQTHIKPVRKLELPNGGLIDVYALNGAMIDAVNPDKNFNNGSQTLVDYDRNNDFIYLIGVGGNPAIRNLGMYSDSKGFVYTVWTNNDSKYFGKAKEILKYFPFDLIENDYTDMSMAIGNHIILHKREAELEEAEENMMNEIN